MVAGELSKTKFEPSFYYTD